MMLQSILNIPPENQRLIWDRKELMNELILQNFKIQAQSCIQLLFFKIHLFIKISLTDKIFPIDVFPNIRIIDLKAQIQDIENIFYIHQINNI